MRAIATCGVFLALIGVSCAASAETLYNFQIAGWQAGAYTNSRTNQFNHCGASASYRSGIVMSFAITRSYHWSLGLAHAGWRLTKGQSYDIAFTVDADPPIRGRAEAVGASAVEVPLAESTRLFQRFREGQQLRIAAAGQVFAFNLTGTSQLLPALVRCVQANLQPAAPPTVTANPFVAPAPPSSGSANAAQIKAFRAETVALAANILGSAGVVGFRIHDRDESVDFATWEADKTFGIVRIEAKDRPEIIPAKVIAFDAAGCKAKFASGSIPATRKDEGPRLFTKCGEGEEGWTAYYFILPRKAGGHYVVGTGARGSDEPARQIESDMRQAAMVVTGR